MYIKYDRDSKLMRWINLVVFTVILLIVSLMMMRKIRLRFHSLYTEYGCSLRTVYIVQGISILSLTVFSLLEYYSDSWSMLYDSNPVLFTFLCVLGQIMNWIIPMIAQLNCLIFGYIRHTKPHQENERPDYITYFDPIVEYYTRSHSQARPQEQDHKDEKKDDMINLNASYLSTSRNNSELK